MMMRKKKIILFLFFRSISDWYHIIGFLPFQNSEDGSDSKSFSSTTGTSIIRGGSSIGSFSGSASDQKMRMVFLGNFRTGGTSSLSFSSGSSSDSEDDDDEDSDLGFYLRCLHYRDFHFRLGFLCSDSDDEDSDGFSFVTSSTFDTFSLVSPSGSSSDSEDDDDEDSDLVSI